MGAAGRGAAEDGVSMGAAGRVPPACVASGDASKKGSDAREAGTVWWSASRMSISRRSSASMRRCRS
eukprot:836808-Pleurochrysis_carterae.AAC.1